MREMVTCMRQNDTKLPFHTIMYPNPAALEHYLHALKDTKLPFHAIMYQNPAALTGYSFALNGNLHA